MEVMIPTTPTPTPVEFNFDSSNTSPYISAPSSPRQFGAFFFSAPTSPTIIKSSSSSVFFTNQEDGEFTPQNQHLSATAITSGIPFKFNWEVEVESFKTVNEENDSSCMDFAFDFSGQLETCSLTAADELFDEGKIKPLKPPPRYQSPSPADSPRSPKKKKLIKDYVLSPRRHKNYNMDPFAAAHEKTCRQQSTTSLQGRGRETSTSIRQKKTRSLSPFRVSDLLIDSQNHQQGSRSSNSKMRNTTTSSTCLFPNSPSFASFWYRNKWKLKDLLLFTSASEGRVTTTQDQMNKYGMLLKKNRHQEDVRNSSFRSSDSVGSSTSTSSSMRRVPVVSAHELHYTANRAVSEEMKKKTFFLPYKRNLLGCLGLRSGIHIHSISKGFASSFTPTTS